MAKKDDRGVYSYLAELELHKNDLEVEIALKESMLKDSLKRLENATKELESLKTSVAMMKSDKTSVVSMSEYRKDQTAIKRCKNSQNVEKLNIVKNNSALKDMKNAKKLVDKEIERVLNGFTETGKIIPFRTKK